ncbi:hypothetical protein LAZ67_8001943, partial [Cordylochernes scorpioides]
MSSGNTPSLARAESPSKAEEKPARLGSKAQPSAELPARNALKFNSSMKSTKNQRYANPATGGKDANPAAPTDFAAASSSEAAAQAHRNWAELSEDSNSEYEGNFTIVQKRKRRRGSANSSPAAAPSSNLGGARTNRRPQSSAGWAPRAQEVRTTRAHIVEARARQASSTEDHCVYVERSPELEPYHYMRAMDRMFGSTREVFQVTKMNGHFLVGLANRGMAERLVNEGLEVEGTLHRVFPFRKRAERITVGNLPFFVGDAAVISALTPLGRVTSIAPKLMKAGPYTYNDGRREAFIILREGMTIEGLPTRLNITIKGEAWPAYLSSGIRCSRCRGQGHRRANCPLLAGRTNAPGPATPTSPTSVPSASAPGLPQQPSAQPPPPASPSPAMEVSEVPSTSRAALPPAAPRQSPPVAPAIPTEMAPPAPPPVAPAPSLRAPGSHGPAVPTLDVEMSIDEDQRYANPPTGVGNANLAAARGDVTTGSAAATSSNGAARVLGNWADYTEDQRPGEDDDFTVVRNKRRRRDSPGSPTAAKHHSNPRGAGANSRPRSSTGWVPRAEEIKTTRAHIAEARARQASSAEDNCVYVEYIPELEPYHYIRAVDRMIGGTNNVLQVSKINGHYLMGLNNRSLAERLISEGLEVEGTLFRAFPFRKRAMKITVGNLPFFVEDFTIISALTPYGRVTSIAPKLMKAGPYIYNDGRRDAFIVLHEGVTTERLPTRLEIKIKGEVWPAYLSYGIRCSRCHGQGHRRANCPLLAGRSNAPRPATPTSPTGVPPVTTPRPPQPPSAQPPPPASPSPAMEVSEVPSTSRAALHPPAAPRQSPPVAPAIPTEMAPPAPPPVTPAPSLRAPGGHGPAVPTLDVEMSIEETSTSSTSSSGTSTREGLVTFLERNPGVSFAQTDALGLGREEVLDLLSSKTKARKRGPLLSPSQGDALAGLIRQLLGLKPVGNSNIYKVLGQVRAALKTSPAAVPPTPPLPAPQPAGPIPPAPDEEEMTPIMREECMVIEIFKKLKHLTCLRPLYQSGIQPNDLKDAILFIDERESLMARLTPAMRGVLAEFLSAAIEPARGKHPDGTLGPATLTSDVDMTTTEETSASSPAAVISTLPLPAPRPAEPMLPTTYREELTPPLMTPPPAPRLAGPIPPVPHGDTTTPAMTTPPPPLSMDRRWKMAGDLIHGLSREIDLEHTFQSQVDIDDIVRAVLYPGDREPFIKRLPTRDRYILGGFISTAIWRARDADPSMLEILAPPFSPPASGRTSRKNLKFILAESPQSAVQVPERPSVQSQPGDKISPKERIEKNSSKEFSMEFQRNADPPARETHASPAAARDDVTAPLIAASCSASTANPAPLIWGDSELAEMDDNDAFTVVRTKKRRRDSPVLPAMAAQSNSAGASRRQRSSTGWIPPVQEIRTTTAHVMEARARQAICTEEQCLYLEYCPDYQSYQYLRAIERVVGGHKNIFQFSKINGHYLLGLASKSLAEHLVREGLEIEGTLIRTFPFRKSSTRITVGNLPFFVADAAIIDALSRYGRITSIAPKLLKAGEFTYTDGRREAFILLHDGITIDKLPTRFEIRIKGEAWPAFLSHGIKCSKCHGQGHKIVNCPHLHGRSATARRASPPPSTDLPPSTAPGLPRQSSAAPPSPSNKASRAPSDSCAASLPSAAPWPSTPAPPASPMQAVTPAPPPMTPSPEDPMGPRSAASRPESTPPARPDFIAPCGPLPAQGTLGPATHTPDVDMTTTEEPSAPSPAAVSTPPLPAPQPAGPTPSAPHKEDPTPAMTPPSPPPTPMEEDLPPNSGDCIHRILTEIISSKIDVGPLVDDEISWTDAIDAILHSHSRAPFLARLSPILKKNYAVFFEAAIERARDSHPRILS